MAFTGVAVIQKLSESRFRITGLSLAPAATGTIGLVQNVLAEVAITAPEVDPYETKGTHGVTVDMAMRTEINVIASDAAGTDAEPVAVTKAGTTAADFLATLTNRDAAAAAFELYVQF